MMKKMSIKQGDKVIVLNGKDKGKTGEVLTAMPREGKVVVQGVNVCSRHTKPRKQGETGGIVQREAAMYASKVQVVCPKCNKGTRIAHKIENGKKTRVCKPCGAALCIRQKWHPLSTRSSVISPPCRSPRSTRSS